MAITNFIIIYVVVISTIIAVGKISKHYCYPHVNIDRNNNNNYAARSFGMH